MRSCRLWSVPVWVLALCILSHCQSPEPRVQPYSVQLHLHGSASEGTGSINGGNRRASELGIDVLFWTDHDFRVSYWSFVNGFDFEGPDSSLVQKRPDTTSGGGEGLAPQVLEFALLPSADNGNAEVVEAELSSERSWQGRRSLRLSARGDSEVLQDLFYDFSVTRKRMHRSLAAEVKLKFSIYPEPEVTGYLPAVRIKLSQHFEEYRQQELRYVLWNGEAGALPVQRKENVGYVPLTFKEGEWNEYEVNVSRDAQQQGRGGIDNALSMVGFGMEIGSGKGTVYFDDYQITHGLQAESLQKRLLALSKQAGEEFGVVNYVGQEISYGKHVNTWGYWVPFFDYRKAPGGLGYRETVDYIHEHGSIASINHYVGSPPSEIAGDPTAVEEFLYKKASELISEKAWGADLLEHQSGNDPQKLRAYVRVWDRLSREGLYITGEGVSDAHSSSRSGWHVGGNLVTWVLAEVPEERRLIEALRKGSAYFGDPARFKGSVDFQSSDGHRLGEVVVTDAQEHTIRFKLTELQPGNKVRVVFQGDLIEEFTAKEPVLEKAVTIPTRERCFVRLGVWTEEGRGILITNPIYFVPPRLAEAVPDDRRVQCDGR